MLKGRSKPSKIEYVPLKMFFLAPVLRDFECKRYEQVPGKISAMESIVASQLFTYQYFLEISNDITALLSFICVESGYLFQSGAIFFKDS